VIRFESVSFEYPDRDRPVLDEVSLRVPEGELCLVVGPTGSGKSTLLRATNGHVPRFTGGRLTGDVSVDGRSIRTWMPRDLADVVGIVGQDPAAGFVTDVVEDELAYSMENIGVGPDAMRRRVEDVLDLLDLHALRHRPLSTLSGGQQQRVAIGSVLTANPRVLVLDEPTSALDPAAAEEVLAALTRLVHDLGITVLIAEHRLERVAQYADRLALVRGGGAPFEVGDPATVLSGSPVAPPVVELGRLAGWRPVPLSIRDARRHARPLRDRLDGTHPARTERTPGDVIARVRSLSVDYGRVRALHDVDLDLRTGEVVALMGRNGAGKSTLLARLVGLRAPDGGSVEVDGVAPHRLSGREAFRHVALVPQDASLLLDAQTVEAECRAADRDANRPSGHTRRILDSLIPSIDGQAHPRDLSEGQRLALALAVVLAAEPPLLLLDEPTRGLDYAAKHRLIDVLDRLASAGHCVVVATHDVEVVAAVADRAVVLADGDVVADGPARDVVTHSPVFAPQVAKVLAPLPWLTVAEVQAALRGAA
jgi:energy-coupling factor transport system ATP-binding protein